LLVITSGCILQGRDRETPPANLSVNRTVPNPWRGRLPGPSQINLGRTNSIKGVQQLDGDTYTLIIDGVVENPITMTFKDILEHPFIDRSNIMYCVEGWSWSADWRGIVVRDLLAQAKPKPEAKKVIFHAADGYTSSILLEQVNGSDAFFLAYMANGQFLPEKAGYPVRLVAEGKWGYKWVKWVTRLEITDDEDHLGYWENYGYSDEANVT
jgi:DMSO/TMAO reductase YedYZ molybdopterin-dependent catalytic subunit